MNDHIIHQLHNREATYGFNRSFQKANKVGNLFVENLGLERVLKGHTGCVNCLDWNYYGDILASGSDDRKVILWDFQGKKALKTIDTSHRGNIFSVKFMPMQDELIVTGAADRQIFLHELVKDVTIGSTSPNGRVKRIATCNAEPKIFLSASEDGMIRQFDIRNNISNTLEDTVLVNLTTTCGPILECKCVATSPTNPNHFAVGCNDPYVRLFDRRMLSRKVNALYFAPGHLNMGNARKDFVTTYLTFNASGNELLANLGNEQIYIFDLYEKKIPCILTQKMVKFEDHCETGCTASENDVMFHTEKKPAFLPFLETKLAKMSDDQCNFYRTQGNQHYDKKKFTSAISMYNEALLHKRQALVYSNRAAAYIQRKWVGDDYAALNDCCAALDINPENVKAHYRLARCLLSLSQPEKAKKFLEHFKILHPEHSESGSCLSLENSIDAAFKEKSETQPSLLISPCEQEMRENSFDFKYRYCGHCNASTDIKEANFFGDSGKFIIAGSDEGNFFVWERETTNLVRVMQADSCVVNCLQPNPVTGTLATSGLDNEIKLWHPNLSLPDIHHVVSDVDSLMEKNQKIMAESSGFFFSSAGIDVQSESGESHMITCQQS